MRILSIGCCLLAAACGSASPQPEVLPDAAADLSGDLSPEAAPQAPQAGCADLPAAATCRLSGTYELTYDQLAVESTPDTSGFSCRQVSPRPRVTFTPGAARLCADVDELEVSADGCAVELTARHRTDGGSEYWVNETALRLTFTPQDGGALVGQGTARLQVSGFHICAKTATVSARSP